MVYCPDPSVAATRTFSMSAGLAASTVTPGSTAPDASLTTPAIDAWANAATGRTNNQVHVSRVLIRPRTYSSFPIRKDDLSRDPAPRRPIGRQSSAVAVQCQFTTCEDIQISGLFLARSVPLRDQTNHRSRQSVDEVLLKVDFAQGRE